MKKEYRAMYDKLAPLKSDEELLNSILSSRKGNITMKTNENKSKKRITKAIAIPIAAALALGATAVGAVAVYNRNVAEEYANVLQQPEGAYFEQEYKTADGENVNLNETALSTGLYDQLNIELNKTFEYEDFTIEFPGAVCDGRDILVMYNITFNKDLDCLKYEDQCFWLCEDYDRHIDGLHSGTRSGQGIMTEVDGKKVYKGFKDYSGIENFDESLTLHFEQIRAAIGSFNEDEWYRPEIDIELEIPLTADFSKFNKTFTADTAQHVDLLGWYEWDVESVDISSLLITFNVKTDGAVPEPHGNIFKTSSPVFPVNVTMNDGSTLELSSDDIYRFDVDQETKEGWFMAVMNYPLDVENVQSVQFANVVIDVDGNASTIEIPEIYEKYDENGRLVER